MLLSIASGEQVLPPYVINGVAYPENIEFLWSAQELAAIGLVRVANPPPPPAPIPAISDRQFFQKLANDGLVTREEALAAVSTGALPAVLETYLAGLGPDDQFAARMLLSGATVFERAHPLTNAIGAAFGLAPSQVDLFFIAAAQL